MPILSPELIKLADQLGRDSLPYLNRRKAQLCTSAGNTDTGNPKTGAQDGRVWVKAEGNHAPIQAFNAIAFDGAVGPWVIVADERRSGEPTVVEVLPAENTQKGGGLYTAMAAAGPQQSPDTMRPKHNYTAVTAPTVTDDSSKGYSTNSLWVNVITKIAHICVNASVGTAEWEPLTSGATAPVLLAHSIGPYTIPANRSALVSGFCTIAGLVTLSSGSRLKIV